MARKLAKSNINVEDATTHELPNGDLGAEAEARDNNAEYARFAPKVALENFQIDRVDFEEWLRRFNRVAFYYSWPDQQKCRELAVRLQGEPGRYFDELEEEKKTDWGCLVATLKARYVAQSTPLRRAYDFCTLTHQLGESVDEFYSTFMSAYRETDMKLSDSALSAMFIAKIRQSLRASLLNAPAMTFGETVQRAQNLDLAASRNLSSLPPGKRLRPNPNLSHLTGRQPRPYLPERNSEGQPLCFNCREYGHVARYCRAKPKTHSAAGMTHEFQLSGKDSGMSGRANSSQIYQ